MICQLCECEVVDEHGHADGCPLGPAEVAGCGHCGTLMPLTDLAAHMRDEHGADVTRDTLEQTYIEAKQDWERPPVPSEYIQVSTDEVLRSIGWLTATGRWPDSVNVISCLLVTMERLIEARAILARLEQQLNRGEEDST